MWSVLFVLATVGSAVYHYCTDDLSLGQRIAIPVIYVATWLFWTYCVMVVWSYYYEVSREVSHHAFDQEDPDDDDEVPIMLASLKRSKKAAKIYPHSIWEESSLSSSNEQGGGQDQRQSRGSKTKKSDSRREMARAVSYHQERERQIHWGLDEKD